MVCFSDLNAVTRALDLLSKVLAPLCFGVILSAISLAAGAVFIAAWNVASVVLEYALLIRVYRLVPRLAFKDVSGESSAANFCASQTGVVTRRVCVLWVQKPRRAV